MVRYPHTFQYIGKSGGFSNGDYLPGTPDEPVPFEGRFVAKQELRKNTDGSMSQVEGKIHCKAFDATPEKGDKITFGTRSLTVFSPDLRQASWTLWVI